MMSRILTLLVLVSLTGCGNRPGWGFSWGQGTVERQKARATIHDPYPLDDIGPEVVGGRPREYASPQSEPVRNNNAPRPMPNGYGYPR